MFKVILCGGVGSRLWPISTENIPKQFNSNLSKQTFFEQTINRLSNKHLLSNVQHHDNGLEKDKYIVVSKQNYFEFIAQSFVDKQDSLIDIIIEPTSKNTAPAIALAAAHILQHYQDGIMVISPSDHFIDQSELFIQEITRASQYAEQGMIVTLGINPTSPEIGYGYIKKGNPLDQLAFKVDKFIEKPNLQLAEQFLESQQYLWNSGIFIMKASIYMAELFKYQPQIALQVNQSINFAEIKPLTNGSCIYPSKEFNAVESISVDYAVMEKSKNIVVYPLALSWSDMGSWQAFYRISEKDENQNVVIGETISINTHGCYIHSPKDLVCTVGVKDLIIINYESTTIIVDKSEEQRIPELIFLANQKKQNK